MNRIAVSVSFLALVACDRGSMIDDEAARLRGEYAVETYVINDDTLFSAGRLNKIGVSDFKVIVSRKSADSLSLGYSFTKDSGPKSILIRHLNLSGGNGHYQLSMPSAGSTFYEGSISENVYIERTSLAGLGFILLPENYPLDNVSDPNKATIEITARKTGY